MIYLMFITEFFFILHLTRTKLSINFFPGVEISRNFSVEEVGAPYNIHCTASGDRDMSLNWKNQLGHVLDNHKTAIVETDDTIIKTINLSMSILELFCFGNY